MAKLHLGVLGSGAGSNMQSIVDSIEAGTLDADIRLVLADVEDAKILDRARRHGIPCQYLDCAPWKTKAAEQKSQAYQEMKKLFADTYVKYMKTGYVGENKDGYVTYIGKPEKCDPKVAAAAGEAVKKLNAARKAFYEEEAKSQNTTVAEIQKTYAAVYAAKAKGIWVEVSNGKTYEWKKF